MPGADAPSEEDSAWDRSGACMLTPASAVSSPSAPPLNIPVRYRPMHSSAQAASPASARIWGRRNRGITLGFCSCPRIRSITPRAKSWGAGTSSMSCIQARSASSCSASAGTRAYGQMVLQLLPLLRRQLAVHPGGEQLCIAFTPLHAGSPPVLLSLLD